MGRHTDDPSAHGTILRPVDRLADRDEAIQVTSLTNGPEGAPLLEGSGYHVIAVGRMDGSHQQESIAVDGFYGADRTVPTPVVPIGTTSGATAVVAAATLGVQVCHEGRPSLSEGSTTIAGVGAVYNRVIAFSTSLFGNAENLYIRLVSGGRYELRVTAIETADVSWNYALAWRLEPAPAPFLFQPARGCLRAARQAWRHG